MIIQNLLLLLRERGSIAPGTLKALGMQVYGEGRTEFQKICIGSI